MFSSKVKFDKEYLSKKPKSAEQIKFEELSTKYEDAEAKKPKFKKSEMKAYEQNNVNMKFWLEEITKLSTSLPDAREWLVNLNNKYRNPYPAQLRR